MNIHVPALQKSLPEVVAEYDAKKAALADVLEATERAISEMKMGATVCGEHGGVDLSVRLPWDSQLQKHLVKSAWFHVYKGLNINILATPSEKKQFEQAMADPPDFTLDNISATFGKYIKDPRGSIIRGLAEVFCDLDHAYKSHDKVRIGVDGLPKRVILSSVGGYSSWGRERVMAVLNALAAYQGRTLIEHKDMRELDDLHGINGHRAGIVRIRDLTIKKFKNGNAHVMFDKGTLQDINKALAQFYGNVLPDTSDEKPTEKAQSTAVSKDLQFYGTPRKTVDYVVDRLIGRDLSGKKVLEPSCGEGAFMDKLHQLGAHVVGCEVDVGRANICIAKGHRVIRANFLDTVAQPIYDYVVMNPPFYGRHYAKHVRHAFKFLKPGGTLYAILPITARYDHHELDDLVPTRLWSEPWHDLPIGSFSESGTNINTAVLTIHKPT